MKGLLLTLLAPTAFAQLQAPLSTLDALPAAQPAASVLASPDAPLGAEALGRQDELPLSALDALAAGPLQPAGASLSGDRSLLRAAPLSGLESIALPDGRGADLSHAQAGFFDRAGSFGALSDGLGAAGIEAPAPLADSARLGRLYPRVAYIVDPLTGPASEATVRLIDTLQQKGVQIVFVSQRADRGRDSVDEVLTSRLKGRREHPLLIASASGAKIYAHSSQAKNPKPVLPNAESFSEKEWSAIDAAVLETARRRRSAAVHLPTRPERDAFSYEAELPAKSKVELFTKTLNQRLRSAGLPYRAEPKEAGFVIRAYKPELSASRIARAVESLAHRDSFERPGEILVLADPRKDGALLKTFPAGVYVHAIQDEASLDQALGAVLGGEGLEKVSVFRSEIRAYLAFLARHEPGSFDRGGGWSGGRDSDRPRELDFYKGVVMKELLARLSRDWRNGEYHLATIDQARARLRSMWLNPKKAKMRLPAELQRTAANEAWRQRHRKAFMATLANADAWLRNFYTRKFPNYPEGILEEFIQTTANIPTDGKSLITIEMESPYTRRRYLVHVRPDRAEVRRGLNGPELIASVYRFGKFRPGKPDEVEAKLLAMAMLKGYAHKAGEYYDEEGRPVDPPETPRRPDDVYLVNGRPVRSVVVNFEYLPETVPYRIAVSELPQTEQEAISIIEKMKTNAAFQREYKKDHEAGSAAKKARKKAKRSR